MCGRTREEKQRRDEKVASMAAAHRCKGVVFSHGGGRRVPNGNNDVYTKSLFLCPSPARPLPLDSRVPESYKNIARIVLAQVSISSQPLKVPAVFATCIYPRINASLRPSTLCLVLHRQLPVAFSIFVLSIAFSLLFPRLSRLSPSLARILKSKSWTRRTDFPPLISFTPYFADTDLSNKNSKQKFEQK